MGRNDSVNDSFLESAEGQLLLRNLELLAELPNQLRHTLADHQWSTISLFVREAAFTQTLLSGSWLQATQQVQSLVLITSVTVMLPGGVNGGLLQLGSDIQLPMQGGLNHLAPLQLLLQSGDVRQISYAGGQAGPAALLLTGQQLPTTGVLAR